MDGVAVKRATEARGAGFSLVELMVALTIGAILLGGAVTLFVNNRANYQINNDLSRLQESARFALDMMSHDIRMAGYFGCVSDTERVTNRVPVATAGDLWDISSPIEGVEHSAATPAWQPSGHGTTLSGLGLAADIGSGATPAPQVYKILAGTDALTLRYLVGDRIDAGGPAGTPDGIPDWQVVAPSNIGTLTLNYYDANSTAATELATTGLAAIADCGSGDVFQVKNLAGGTITVQNNLSRAYDPSSQPMLAPFHAVRYYVGVNGNGEPALFRARIGAALQEVPEELFEGVENMQVLYGVDIQDADGNPQPDGIPEQYYDAVNVPDWTRVHSVRIGLLLRSQPFGRSDAVLGQPNQVSVNRTLIPVDTTDSRRRRVFTTTVLARNFSE